MKVTRENIDELYRKVNKIIDSYFSFNITAAKLKKYLKPNSENYNEFIDRNDLSGISGISKIICDIVDDRVSIENDSDVYNGTDDILTFEKFNVSDIIQNGNANKINYEKALADMFNVSLGHVYEVDSLNNMYSIKGITYYVLSSDDIQKLSTSFHKDIIAKLKETTVNLDEFNIKIELDKYINDTSDTSADNIQNVICNILDVEYIGEIHEFYVYKKL